MCSAWEQATVNTSIICDTEYNVKNKNYYGIIDQCTVVRFGEFCYTIGIINN